MIFFFYLFAALAVIGGLGVVAYKNPVTSAFSLIISFLGLAALFIQLDAYLVGILQILVYAGAIMVLFLFIIMLLDIREEEEERTFLGTNIFGASLVGFGFLGLVIVVLLKSGSRLPATPSQSSTGLGGEWKFRRPPHRENALQRILVSRTNGGNSPSRRHRRRDYPEPEAFEIKIYRDVFDRYSRHPPAFPLRQRGSLRHRTGRGPGAPQPHRDFHVSRIDVERRQPLAGRLFPLRRRERTPRLQRPGSALFHHHGSRRRSRRGARHHRGPVPFPGNHRRHQDRRNEILGS